MDNQRELLGRRWVNDNVTTAELYLLGERAQLSLEKRGKRCASRLRYPLIRPRKRLEPLVQDILYLRGCFALVNGARGNGLKHRKQVLRSMVQFANDQLLAFLAVGNGASDL